MAGGRKPGSPKVGGRKKGSRNWANSGKTAEVERTGITPLDYMLSIMRDPTKHFLTRLDAAKSAAPYLHPKLASIDHTVQGQSVIVIKGGIPGDDPTKDDDKPTGQENRSRVTNSPLRSTKSLLPQKR